MRPQNSPWPLMAANVEIVRQFGKCLWVLVPHRVAKDCAVYISKQTDDL